MNRKLGVGILLSVLVLGLVFSIISVSADTEEGGYAPGSLSAFANFGDLKARWDLWKVGYAGVGADQMGLLTETLKFIVLFIIIFVVYAAFSQLEFPQSTAMRFILSALVGILATFMITTQEMLTALLSYGALATTIIIAVPLIVLIGLTVMSAYKANAIGLYASKVLWAVFGIFLIIKGLVLLSMFQYFVVQVDTNQTTGQIINFTASYSYDLSTGKPIPIPNYLQPFLPNKIGTKTVTVKDSMNNSIQKNVSVARPDLNKIAQLMGKAEPGNAWILIVTGCVVIFFMVFKSKWIYVWLEKEARDSAIEAAKQNINLSAARDKLQADAMRQTAKT